MKHSFKNNSSGNNNKQNKKNSNSNFSSLNINSSKSNNKFPINSAKKKNSPNFRESDKNKINHSHFKKRKTVAKSDFEFSKKTPDIAQEHVNKKNFDDWVWGKHSVFETLSSERAINRIWCTSEIFSSEKFYILLKNLKSK